MEYLNFNSLLLPLVTGLGVAGFGNLAIPQVIQDLLKHPWFQWLLVFGLIYQGGGGQNIQLSLVATVVLFVLFQALDMFMGKKEGYYSY